MFIVRGEHNEGKKGHFDSFGLHKTTGIVFLL